VRDGQPALDDVMQHLQPLVQSYADSAARGDALVVRAV
jgi:ABC-type transporter Mla subunit MlaD